MKVALSKGKFPMHPNFPNFNKVQFSIKKLKGTNWNRLKVLSIENLIVDGVEIYCRSSTRHSCGTLATRNKETVDRLRCQFNRHSYDHFTKLLLVVFSIKIILHSDHERAQRVTAAPRSRADAAHSLLNE